MSLPERAATAYRWFKERERELSDEADRNEGKLARHNLWRLAYYRQPYLLLKSDEEILERFGDVFSNGMDIDAEGKITVKPMMVNDSRFGRLFTEIIEETNWRGVLTRDSVSEGTSQISAYFESGTPVGVKMFEGRTEGKGDCLVKFSKREFVQEAHRHGRLRIAPASEYAKGSHLRAVKDLETVRPYKIKAFNEVMQGASDIEFQGNRLPIVRGTLDLDVTMNDYFLFSTCTDISRRMPTDFEADAALIIKDRQAFIHRLRSALLREHHDWEFLAGEVYYYDPYNDIPKDMNQEFWKHISYAYQREHRCVLRRRRGAGAPLQPFFVSLGPLDDISEVVVA